MTVAEYAAALAALPSDISRLPITVVNIATMNGRIYVAHLAYQPLCYHDGEWHPITFQPQWHGE